MFKILGSDFGTVGIRRRKQVCADKFLAMVTEDVVAFEPRTVAEGQGHFAKLHWL